MCKPDRGTAACLSWHLLHCRWEAGQQQAAACCVIQRASAAVVVWCWGGDQGVVLAFDVRRMSQVRRNYQGLVMAQ